MLSAISTNRLFALTFASIASIAVHSAWAQDWPTWGRDNSRNMVSDAKNVPDDFDPGKNAEGSEERDMKTTRGVKWVVKLGSQSYGNAVVGGGRVLVGTNNESPRDPQHKGDRGIVMCFDEQTGKFLWQLVVPKLGSGKVSDWEFLGICSSPTIDGDRAYVVTNRCEVLCLDMKGMANGNDGPFKEEDKYFAGPGKPPAKIGDRDADILWRFDMREELGVFPHNTTASAPLIIGDKLYVSTGNGVDWGHTNIPNPKAPAFVCLDKKTGELVAEEASGVSERVFHGNWVSAAYGFVGPGEKTRGVVVFPGPDGFAYGFDTSPAKNPDGLQVFKEVFRIDLNPPEYRNAPDGSKRKYATPDGPSEMISTPVFYKGRIYAAIGQDPEHGDGIGAITCFDPSKQNADGSTDITKSAIIWRSKKIDRSMSTVAVADGLVFVGEFTGKVHCFDAETGEHYWVHDTKGRMWGSTLLVDGKVYVGNEDGFLTILAASKQKKLIREIEFGTAIYSTPFVANGVLYISTQTQLFAIDGKKR